MSKRTELRVGTNSEIPVGIWEAWHFEDGEPEERIVDLFGTHIIATPYLATGKPGDAWRVMQIIAELNPDYEVIVP